MRTTYLLVVWTLRAWPVLALCCLAGVHFAALRLLPDIALVNKVMGTVMQIVGGLIVLHSVNENLGTFRSQSLPAVILAWFKSFPLVNRTIVVNLKGSTRTATAGSPGASISISAIGLEARLAEVERQLGEIKAAMQAQEATILRRIKHVKVELSTAIVANELALKRMSNQIEKATVGGFKQQAFGVLLVIYGAVVSVFA